MIFCYSRIDHHELVGFILLGLITSMLPALLAFWVIEEGRMKRMSARFVVGEGEQFLGKGGSGNGRREWLRHPLTTAIIGTVVGTLIATAVMALLR